MGGDIKTIKIGTKEAFVHRGSIKDFAFVIGHGASGNAETGNLPSIADQVTKTGLTVIRYNAGGPLKSRISTLQAILNSQDAELKGIKKWILSGHSMGGRTACAVAQERDQDVAGVVLFSYPLHPPGKQEELRDGDLTALKCPVMVVRGTKDSFSTEPAFSEVMQRMSSKDVRIELVEGGDHSLSIKTKVGQDRFDIFMEKVCSFLIECLGIQPEGEATKNKDQEAVREEPTTQKGVTEEGDNKKQPPKKRRKMK